MQPVSIVIFDTEFTAWEGSNTRGWSETWEHRELIQLAAVKVEVDSHDIQVVNTFNELIKPVRNPRLSDYIVELTGISQSMVDELGVDCLSAISQFYDFCDQGKLACFAWGNDEHILRENCRLINQPMPSFANGFSDLKKTAYKYTLDGAELCSGELADYLGLKLKGHKHNALYDVRSLALALNHWIKTGQLAVRSLFPNSIF